MSICARMYTYIHTYMHAHVNTCIQTYSRTRVYTHIDTRILGPMHTYVLIHIHGMGGTPATGSNRKTHRVTATIHRGETTGTRHGTCPVIRGAVRTPAPPPHEAAGAGADALEKAAAQPVSLVFVLIRGVCNKGPARKGPASDPWGWDRQAQPTREHTRDTSQ